MRSARPASGLTPPTDDEFATREAQLRHALPVLAGLSGLIAATAAASQYWLGTGHFRPLAFALHLGQRRAQSLVLGGEQAVDVTVVCVNPVFG